MTSKIVRRQTPAPAPGALPDERAEQFAAGGDSLTPNPTDTSRKPAKSLPMQMLIRFDTQEQAQLVAEVAKLDRRSKHATALRALIRGLEETRSDLKRDH